MSFPYPSLTYCSSAPPCDQARFLVVLVHEGLEEFAGGLGGGLFVGQSALGDAADLGELIGDCDIGRQLVAQGKHLVVNGDIVIKELGLGDQDFRVVPVAISTRRC